MRSITEDGEKIPLPTQEECNAADSWGKWIAEVKGNPWNSPVFEISVVREYNRLGRESYGWFDENKLMVATDSSTGGWMLAPGIADILVKAAKNLADRLNAEEGR